MYLNLYRAKHQLKPCKWVLATVASQLRKWAAAKEVAYHRVPYWRLVIEINLRKNERLNWYYDLGTHVPLILNNFIQNFSYFQIVNSSFKGP